MLSLGRNNVEKQGVRSRAKDAASASVFVLIVLTLALWCAALVSVSA